MVATSLDISRSAPNDTSAADNWLASNDTTHHHSALGNSQAESQQVDALREQLQRQAQQDPSAFRSAMRTAFGDKASLAQIDQLLDMALADKMPIPANVRFVDAGSLGAGALGAYDSANGGTLFLDRSLLDGNPAQLQAVFNEEMGHHFDALLGGTDATGDEGSVFAQTLDEGPLTQDTLTALRSENDHGLILIDGRLIQVEFMEDAGDEGGDDEGGGGDSDDAGGGGESAGGECGVDSGGDGNGGPSGTDESGDDTGGDDAGKDESEASGECASGEPGDKDEPAAEGHKNGNSETDKNGTGTGTGGDPLDGDDTTETDDEKGTETDDTDLDEPADTGEVPESKDTAPEEKEEEPEPEPEDEGGFWSGAWDAFQTGFANPLGPTDEDLAEEVNDFLTIGPPLAAEDCMADCHSVGRPDPNARDVTEEMTAIGEGLVGFSGVGGAALGVRDFAVDPSLGTFGMGILGTIPGVRAGKAVSKLDDVVDYSRPSGFRNGKRDEVWNDAVELDTGQVRDPVTGRFMNEEQPWDMGHKPGHEFRKHAQSAEERGISRSEFLDEYNKTESYRPELPTSNRSHRGEDRTDEYLGD